MTEFIKRSVSSSVRWSPVMIRGVAWVVAEVCILAAALLNEMEKSDKATTYYGWMIFTFLIVGKAAMTIRLYLDQSLSEHKERLNENSKPASIGNSAVGTS